MEMYSGCKKNPGKNSVQGVWRCTEGCADRHGAWVWWGVCGCMPVRQGLLRWDWWGKGWVVGTQGTQGGAQAIDWALRKVNTCKYPPIGSIIILPDDVYKSSKIMLPKEGLCL